MNKIRKYKKIGLLLVFAFIIFVLSIRYLANSNQIMIIDDEFGYWAIAESLVGRNWRELISISAYYGYGYSFLLLPLLILGLSSSATYKLAIIGNGIMLVLSFILSVVCAEKLFPKVKTGIVILSCFLISFYPNTVVQAHVAWTETLLYFLFWLSLYFLILVQENAKMWKIIILALLLGYMFMVHQRTIGIMIALVICMFIMMLQKRITLKYFIPLVIVLILYIVVQGKIKGYIQGALWVENIGSSANDFGGQVSNIATLFSFVGIKNFVLGLLGRYFYFVVAGGFVWFLGIKQILVLFFRNLIDAKSISERIKKIALPELFILLSFLASVAIALIFMISGFWRLDIIVYARYIENTIGPILLIGFLVLFEKKFTKKDLLMYFISLVICGVVVCWVLGRIDNNTFNEICSVGLARFFGTSGKFTAVYKAILYSVVVTCIIVLLLEIRCRFRRISVVLAGLVMFLFWGYLSDYSINIINNKQLRLTSELEMTADIIGKSGVKEIYYIYDKNYDKSAMNMKYLQYWIPDVKVNVVENFESKEEGVWICENESSKVEESIRDAFVLQKNSLLTVCTGIDSEVRNRLLSEGYTGENEIDLSSCESDIWDDSYNEEFRSNGQAGYMIRNNSVALSTGKYKVNFEVENIDITDDSNIGRCVVLKGKDIISEIPLNSDIGINNYEIEFSCMDSSKIEFNVELNEGAVVKLNSIHYIKTENNYQVGEDTFKDLSEIAAYLSEKGNTSVFYVSEHQRIQFDFSLLENICPDSSIQAIGTKDMAEKEGYYILENRDVNLFELAEQYDILKINSSYILLHSKDQLADYIPLNTQYGISVRDLKRQNEHIFSDVNDVGLTQGVYNVYVDLKSDGYDSGTIYLSVSGKKTENILTENQEQFVGQIFVKSDGDKLSWAVESSQVIEFGDVYIQRISDEYPFDLSEFELLDSEYIDGKIISSDKGGEIYEFPDLNLGMGTYEFTCEIESQNIKKGTIGTANITLKDGSLLQTVDIKAEDFSNGSTVIKMTLDVSRSGLKGVEFALDLNQKNVVAVKEITMKSIE